MKMISYDINIQVSRGSFKFSAQGTVQSILLVGDQNVGEDAWGQRIGGIFFGPTFLTLAVLSFILSIKSILNT